MQEKNPSVQTDQATTSHRPQEGGDPFYRAANGLLELVDLVEAGDEELQQLIESLPGDDAHQWPDVKDELYKLREALLRHSASLTFHRRRNTVTCG